MFCRRAIAKRTKQKSLRGDAHATSMKAIEKLLHWYLESYDDFFHRRWGGRTVNTQEVEKARIAHAMQV